MSQNRLAALLAARSTPLRPNNASLHIMMSGALMHDQAAAAVALFASTVKLCQPDVESVNLLLRAYAHLGEWHRARDAMLNAWRGVGINTESTRIVSDLLTTVCAVASDGGEHLQAELHSMLDEVRILQLNIFWEVSSAASAQQHV
jgi:hypothetical protein